MAKVDLQKIRVTGMKKHYKILMQELHKKGILHIVKNNEFVQKSVEEIDDHFGVFDLARIEFAIEYLREFETGKSKMESILSGGKLIIPESEAKERLKNFAPESEAIISEVEVLIENFTRAKNDLPKIQPKKEILQNLLNLDVPLQANFSTEETKTWIGKISKNQENKIASALSKETNLLDIKILDRDGKTVYFRITVLNKKADKIEGILKDFQVDFIDFSQEFQAFFGSTAEAIYEELDRKEIDLRAKIEKFENQAKHLARNLDDLRILSDYNSWKKTKNDLQYKIFRSKSVFAFEAWMPKKLVKKLEKWIKNVFVGEVEMEKVDKNEGENAPALLSNEVGIASFEVITDMYGLPTEEDVDPTVFLAPFFFIFFGLCLSDVGYGVILTFASLFFVLFGKFGKAAKTSLMLLVYCGIAAIIGGVILGGYFGMTPEQFPMMINPNNTSEIPMFYGQLLNPMEGSGPMIFLGISFGIGLLHLLAGLLAEFIRNIKNKEYVAAFGDSASWMYFLIMLALYGTADLAGLDKALCGKLALSGAILLIITQGRAQKNWLLKPIFGLLGLYSITGYLSDLLSYSRIMALGLATGVIGFAMNLTAGILSDMMPHWTLGILIASLVILSGHGLNFALSLLGAFVHSGRLQFIEFFGKFYDGSGEKFEPFKRAKKYLFFRS